MTDRSRREQADDRRFTEADLNAPSVDEPDVNCRGLAALVIEQARRDVRGDTLGYGPLKYRGEQAARELARAEAFAFLTGATPEWRAMLEDWCEILDFDVERVIRDAKAGCPEAMMGQRQVARKIRTAQKTHEEGDSSPEPPSVRLMACPASPAGS